MCACLAIVCKQRLRRRYDYVCVSALAGGTSVTRKVKFLKHRIKQRWRTNQRVRRSSLGDSRWRPVSTSRLLKWRKVARLIRSGDILKRDAPRLSRTHQYTWTINAVLSIVNKVCSYCVLTKNKTYQAECGIQVLYSKWWLLIPPPRAGFWQWSNTYASWQAGRDQSGEEVEKFHSFRRTQVKPV